MDPRDMWGLQMDCAGPFQKITENILEKLPGAGPKFRDRKTSEKAGASHLYRAAKNL